MEQMPKRKSVYNEERYEQKKEEKLKYRRERYRTIHRKDLNIKVSTGTFTLLPRYARRDGRRGGFINVKDMYKNDGGQGGARVCEAHD